MNRSTKWNNRPRLVSPWRVVVAVAIAAVSLAPAWADAPTVASLMPESRLWLEGNSTLHRFESSATKLEVRMTGAVPPATPDLAGLEALVREGQVQGVEVSIPVATMQSGKNGLDKNMRSALKADANPNITFRLERYAVAQSSATDSLAIDAHGVLTVAGVEKPIDLRVAATRVGNTLRIRGEKQLLMTQFGIKPPTMMMGAVKTSDQVVIRFDLRLAPGQSSSLMGLKGE
jgi:polyisoprenoid-binding protein YceI